MIDAFFEVFLDQLSDPLHMDSRLEARIAEKRAALEQQRPLPPATMRLLDEELRSLLTYHSNAIEGNTLSLQETRLVIEESVTIAGHSLREHLEVTNHAEAYALLTRLAMTPTPISVVTIKILHRLVADKLFDADLVGHFRPIDISDSRLNQPPPQQVPRLMDEWCSWLSGAGMRYPLVVRAAIAHHRFIAVQPFNDSNGHTGRLLLNLHLMQAGYPPALLLHDWRLNYLQALMLADSGQLAPIINVVGQAVEQGLDLYLAACRHTTIKASV